MSSNRLRRQGRIAWKLVAGRRDADTLTGLNSDIAARAEVVHRFSVGGRTQGDQKAQGQSGTHPTLRIERAPVMCIRAATIPRCRGFTTDQIGGIMDTPRMRAEMSPTDAVDFAPDP